MPDALATTPAAPRKRGRPPKIKTTVPSVAAAEDVAQVRPPAALVTIAAQHPNRSIVPARLAIADITEHEACAMLPYHAATAEHVRRSVVALGILHPLIVTSDNRLVDGRYRLAAARSLGIERVTAIVYDPPSPVEFVFASKDVREHLSVNDRALLAVQYQRALKAVLVAERTAAMNAGRRAKSEGNGAAATADRPAAAGVSKRDSRKESCERWGLPERAFNKMKRLADKRPALYKDVFDRKIAPEAAFKQMGKNVEHARASKAAAAFVRPEDFADDQIENRIHVGDAAEVLARVADGVASLVVFSPPYPGVKNDEYDPPLPAVSYERYLADLRQVLEQSLRVSRTGGRMAIVVDNTRNRDETIADVLLPVAQDLTKLAQAVGWSYWNEVAWCKDQIAGTGTTFGSLGKCSAPFLARSHEWILIFCKGTHVQDGDDALCDLTREEHRAWLATEWHVRGEARKVIRDHHPAPYPEEIPRRLIKLFSYRRDLVIDPMSGSGTTTAVAKGLGRRFIGIDRSPKYVAFARTRTGVTR